MPLNNIKNGFNEEDQNSISWLEKSFYFARYVGLSGHIFMGVLASVSLISGFELYSTLEKNYQNRTVKKIEPTNFGRIETSYKCGESGDIFENVCRKVSTLITHRNNESRIFESNIDMIGKDIISFQEKCINDCKIIIERKEGYESAWKKNSYQENSQEVAKEKAIQLVKKLEELYPQYKNKIEVAGIGITLSDNDKNDIKRSLGILGYQGEYDIKSIQNFLLYMNNRSFTQAEKESILGLFSKFYGQYNLKTQGDVDIQIFEGVDGINLDIIILILSLILFLMYGMILLPVVGQQKIRNINGGKEYNAISKNLFSSNDVEKFNKNRLYMGQQSFQDFMKMYDKISEIKNFQIISRKDISGEFKIMFSKKGGKWREVMVKNGKYFYKIGELKYDNLIMSQVLEDLGFRYDNIQNETVEEISEPSSDKKDQ